jgi:hypothetical protein
MHYNFSVYKNLEVSQQSSQPVFESAVVQRRDNGGCKLDASVGARTRPDAKALECNKKRPRMMSSDGEDTIEVVETVPAAPQSKGTESNAHLKERIVAAKVKAVTRRPAYVPQQRQRPETSFYTRWLEQVQICRSRRLLT